MEIYRKKVNPEEAIKLRFEGRTYAAIGRILGVSQQRIYQILNGEPQKGSNKLYHQRHLGEEGYKQKRREYSKEYNRQLKILVLTHYGNGQCACIKCGFNDLRALSIDHINNDGYNHRKNISIGGRSGGSIFYRWLMKNNYPNGYQTLCMNCQWTKDDTPRNQYSKY